MRRPYDADTQPRAARHWPIPVTLLHKDATRTMHIVAHDSVCDGRHSIFRLSLQGLGGKALTPGPAPALRERGAQRTTLGLSEAISETLGWC